MSIINKEELKRQIKEGKGINIEDILDEFKGMLKEVYQTATEIELTDHLGYEKHQTSDNPNYRNGHNKKTLKSRLAISMFLYQEIEMEVLNQS